MPRLSWVFAGRTNDFVGFVVLWLILWIYTRLGLLKITTLYLRIHSTKLIADFMPVRALQQTNVAPANATHSHFLPNYFALCLLCFRNQICPQWLDFYGSLGDIMRFSSVPLFLLFGQIEKILNNTNKECNETIASSARNYRIYWSYWMPTLITEKNRAVIWQLLFLRNV